MAPKPREGWLWMPPLVFFLAAVGLPSRAPPTVAGGDGGGHNVVAAPIDDAVAITPPPVGVLPINVFYHAFSLRDYAPRRQDYTQPQSQPQLPLWLLEYHMVPREVEKEDLESQIIPTRSNTHDTLLNGHPLVVTTSWHDPSLNDVKIKEWILLHDSDVYYMDWILLLMGIALVSGLLVSMVLESVLNRLRKV
ncbi:hypothetical protein Scep_023464 [Stephania cephalantha]|uniref:Uncharacterized protein n=1 Tax=Stephania cephalantha TaxID=152367 RepID=A0AAP0HXE6_9MAGN